MADFVFPPGGNGVTITAPNGITYVWDVENNRWGIKADDNVGGPGLQEVLTNGNVADHTIELTDGSDDLIVIRPEEALIGIASDLESKKPRFRLAHIDERGYPDSHAQWEIDDDGTRNDIDLGGNIEALHVRFDDEETFTLDKTGDAEFTGKVKVQPGTKDNEATVFSQYLALQDSIEILQQEIEALGTVINKSVPHKLIKQSDDVQNQLDNGGFYFGDCPNGNLLDVPDDWSGICFIYVDTVDNNGDFADFGPDSLDPGDLIEGVSETGYFLVEVGVGGYDEGAGKKIAGIEATLLKASGVPGPAGQDYALTAFRLTSNGGIDLPTADERYVQKTGDTMTGNLQLNKQLNVDGKSAFKDSVRVLPTADSSSESFIVFGRVDGYHDNAMLIATNNSWYQKKDDCIEYYGTSDTEESLVTKQYVDNTGDRIFGRRFKAAFNNGDPRDKDGHVYIGGDYFYFSDKDLDNNSFTIKCDHFTDGSLTGSNDKFYITACEKDSDGGWYLVASGYWTGTTDCRTGYVYIKGITWKQKPTWVKGNEYRFKVAPFW